MCVKQGRVEGAASERRCCRMKLQKEQCMCFRKALLTRFDKLWLNLVDLFGFSLAVSPAFSCCFTGIGLKITNYES